ncbi:FHA domain-containing protein [Paenarthrobacter nicotinovorans]|uniref:FHA domain-containing protein n=1 Tax=Paenarthrobacter nicotinovorans TaxID=29320 RepID=UPI00047DCAAE|nr:FHA domain-containing protein [Paenarthrobacter nicotinovorans]
MASSNLSETRYQQGDWFGVVRNGTVVLLGPDTPHALIDTVWGLLESAPEAHEVLHEVTDAFGVSLSRIPPFGIIDAKDALRVFLRGDLELLVQFESGAEQLTGRDVTTWTERRLAGATSYSLRIGGGSASDMPLNSLPVAEGVVLLSALEAAPGEPVSDDVPAIPASAVPVEVLAKDSNTGPAVPVISAAAVPVEVPAKERDAGSAVRDSVSDETMIGYTEADLGLTIAPGQLSASQPTDDRHADDQHADILPAAGRPVDQESHEAEQSPEGVAADGTRAASLTVAPAGETTAAAGSSQAGARPDSPGLQSPETNDDAKEAAVGAPPADGPADGPAVEDVQEASEAPVHTSTTDPLLPTLENTTNYDHLWDKTVMRNIEDAAVRVEDDSDDHDAPVSQMSGAPASKTPDAPGSPVQQPSAPERHGQPIELPPAVEPAVESVEQPPAATGGSGLIDSVPWLRNNPTAPDTGSVPPPLSNMPAVPAIGSVPAPGQAPSARGVDAAPQLPGGWPAAPSPAVDEDSDHDGQTIMKSSLAADPTDAAKPASDAAKDASEAAVANGPSVLARVCSQGHANPPTYPQCSVCGTALSGDAQQVPRPRLGRMRLSTGELIDLDQSLIIGRQPSVSRVQGGTMPKLVQVESPGGDISRSHVEVRLEGWHVMLCDLKATNGTVLIREGQAPRRLAQNEMAILLDGDIAELGDDISLRFEEIL